MLQNKRFQNNETGDAVSILGDNGVFYNLSNGANIKKDIFFQKFSEMVDPTNFFQSQSAAGLQNLAEQFKNIDSSKAMDGNVEPQVRYRQESVSEQLQAPTEYKDMLLRRFEQEQANKDFSQYRVYENEEESAADFERKIKQNQPQQPQRQRPQDPYQEQTQYQPPRFETVAGGNIPDQPIYVSPEEEAFKFFKSFKKVYPITLSVDFDDRIAEPNFIKMMAMNYEGDIIKFYTKEFMNRIYNDPGFLENKIYDKLKSLVFEEEQKKVRTPRAPKPAPKPSKPVPARKKRIIPEVPKEDRSQLQEGI